MKTDVQTAERPAGLAPTACSASARKDDKGVLRKYYDAKPNPLWSELTTACLRFVRYKEKVPCALCGKQRKEHWTCVVRFKASDLEKCMFEVKLDPRWFAAGSPVCEDHPLQPDEREFLRKVRAAQRKQNAELSHAAEKPKDK
jgi:hypothetical protein